MALTKSVILHKLCYWYLNDRNIPMTEKDLIGLFKTLTGNRDKVVVNRDKVVVNQSDEEDYMTDPSSNLWFHFYHDVFKKSPGDAHLYFLWLYLLEQNCPNEYKAKLNEEESF